MRLIDADKLRNELTSICSDKVNDYSKAVKAFIEFIDNAPTVSVYTFKEVEEIRQAAIEQTRISCKHDRPQGEWLEDSGNIACSHCHIIWLYRRTDYCPHCGADMRVKSS